MRHTYWSWDFQVLKDFGPDHNRRKGSNGVAPKAGWLLARGNGCCW